MQSYSKESSQRGISRNVNESYPSANRKDTAAYDFSNGTLRPSKYNTTNRQYLVAPGRHGKLPRWDSEESDASSRRISANTSNPFEDYDFSESNQPSGTVSSKSSVSQTPLDTPDATRWSKLSRDYFKPVTPPERTLNAPGSRLSQPLAPERAARRSGEPSNGPSSHQTAATGDISTLAQSHQEQRPHQQVDSTGTATPGTAIKEASEAQRTAEKEQKRGKRNITIQKYMVASFLIGLNFIFIFASWFWASYYYAYLPFIVLPLALNCVMIASILCFKLRNAIRPERKIEPDHPEHLIMVMPCYNETLEECIKSLDSLVDQVGIEENKKGIMVVCDGRVRGPGMQKTTADHLLQDVFVDRTHHEKIKNAYRAWNGQSMDIEMSRGFYKGVPFYCVVKEQNQGKRDSLIVVRSFLYKFNIRRTNPPMVFSPYLFLSMCNWITRDIGVDQVDHLIGMDADTVFDKDCIRHLLGESKYPNTVGVCGYVAVDFSGGNWNLWSLYQNAEYTIAQGLRRLHQSIATKKVSCLPGCCQLLKICEYTCGDRVLVELFGYHPKPLDGMLKQIRATASEDRNHVCLMLTTHPKAQTRQALWARAFTDVPHSWSVFLSQRRRWSLGATSNDLLLFLSRHCQWFERILALCNVLVWCLNIFIVAAIGCMIVAFMTQPWWIILAFAGIMIVPLTYYIIIATWLPRTMRARVQYLAGLMIFVVCGPFLNIFVLFFSVWNMDSFGWGKTRLVVPDDVKNQLAEKSSDSGNQESDSSSNGNGAQRLDEKNNGQYDEEANVGVKTARPASAHMAPAPGR